MVSFTHQLAVVHARHRALVCLPRSHQDNHTPSSLLALQRREDMTGNEVRESVEVMRLGLHDAKFPVLTM